MKGINMKRICISTWALFTVSLILVAFAAASTTRQDTQQPAPDNTKTNKNSSPTADQQKMNPADREITKKIRMAIQQDKSISVYAHNIKVITQDGKVTLKGPVRSEEEKTNIASKAVAVAGEGNVTNQIDVVAAKQ
jgi:osmotically-inducible protein OsmY